MFFKKEKNIKSISRIDWRFVLLAALGGYSLNLVGVLYTADLLLIAGGVVAIINAPSLVDARKVSVVLSILGFLCLACVMLDVANGIDFHDYARGFARNIIFILAIFVGYVMAEKSRLETLMLVLCVAAISNAAMIYLNLGVEVLTEIKNIPSYFKFFGLIYIGILGLMVASWSLFLSRIIILGLAAILITAADFRSGTILVLMPFWILRLRGYGEKGRKYGRLLVIIFMVVVFACMPFVLSLFQSTALFSSDVIARRQLSNDLRLEMATYAAHRIAERPLTGYGSWSNPSDFISAIQQEDEVVVHSFFLQFGYEYGVLGLLIVLFLLIISLLAFWRLLDSSLIVTKKGRGPWLVCWFCWGLFVFNLFMGGLSGYTRVTQGLTGGLLLFLAISPAARDAFWGQNIGVVNRSFRVSKN